MCLTFKPPSPQILNLKACQLLRLLFATSCTALIPIKTKLYLCLLSPRHFLGEIYIWNIFSSDTLTGCNHTCESDTMTVIVIGRSVHCSITVRFFRFAGDLNSSVSWGRGLHLWRHGRGINVNLRLISSGGRGEPCSKLYNVLFAQIAQIAAFFYLHPLVTADHRVECTSVQRWV